ncbi:WYL domain-containing protein [Clostridioides sp. ES-S-0171-01]|nr:WYL domain-containing protein [Clostridioides sp. ES-S-0171-01]MCC0687754.1 WYL domain-containing protein [Clostridioides sp. ES-S-0056-01]MCC0714763.1 WYL domain-containing protein [Clostridioides sp. ES-S-0077-01]UDN53244.1 WYL domain-containing protein [Clostridioides sp. ES-S-0054-01]
MKRGVYLSKEKRLTDVWTYINDRQKFTIKELSEEFNLSTKTIQRYLIELNKMGLPIQTEKGRNGGYRVLNNSYIPPVVFTEKEVMTILFALKSLQIYNYKLMEIEINSIMRKVSYERKSNIRIGIENMKRYIGFVANDEAVKSSDVAEFFRASSESLILNIKYKFGNQVLEKNICPIGIYLNKGTWFSPVYDYKSDKIILIRIDKIIEIKKVGESKEVHISLNEWLETAYSNLYESILSIKKIGETICLNVLLTKEGVSKIKSSSYDLDIKLNEDGSGVINTFIKHEEIDWYVSILFSLGSDAKVMEPKFINKLLYDKADELRYFYEENMV